MYKLGNRRQNIIIEWRLIKSHANLSLSTLVIRYANVAHCMRIDSFHWRIVRHFYSWQTTRISGTDRFCRGKMVGGVTIAHNREKNIEWRGKSGKYHRDSGISRRMRIDNDGNFLHSCEDYANGWSTGISLDSHRISIVRWISYGIRRRVTLNYFSRGVYDFVVTLLTDFSLPPTRYGTESSLLENLCRNFLIVPLISLQLRWKL